MRARRGRIDVLIVCTGNVCRSPYVEARLRAALPGLAVASAGTDAAPRIAPPQTVLGLLADREIAGPPSGSQLLRRRHLRSASLILTAEWLHSVQVARLDPAAADRTFTLRQLARLLTTTPQADERLLTTTPQADERLLTTTPQADERLLTAPQAETGVDAVLRRARAARQTAVPRTVDDDLADPYSGPWAGYDRMAIDADAALEVLIPALGGAVPEPAPSRRRARVPVGVVPLRPWTR